MSLSTFARWLASREWAQDFAGASYFYPVVLATHLVCIALFGGLILITNLRLMGWALKNQSVSDVLDRLRAWKWIGFTVMVSCGILLAGSEADKYCNNPFFWIKMTLLALIGVHGLLFRHSVYRNTGELDRAPALPREAKLAASLSLILWISVVCFGRLIGYYETPLLGISAQAVLTSSPPPSEVGVSRLAKR